MATQKRYATLPGPLFFFFFSFVLSTQTPAEAGAGKLVRVELSIRAQRPPRQFVPGATPLGTSCQDARKTDYPERVMAISPHPCSSHARAPARCDGV